MLGRRVATRLHKSHSLKGCQDKKVTAIAVWSQTYLPGTYHGIRRVPAPILTFWSINSHNLVVVHVPPPTPHCLPRPDALSCNFLGPCGRVSPVLFAEKREHATRQWGV